MQQGTIYTTGGETKRDATPKVSCLQDYRRIIGIQNRDDSSVGVLVGVGVSVIVGVAVGSGVGQP